MKKEDFVNGIHSDAEGLLTKEQATFLFESMLDRIATALYNGERVLLTDICTIKPTTRKERTYANPATKEGKIVKPAHVTLKVTTNKNFAKTLNV